MKADLHLATCVAAKILQLTDTFQAKLGWLVGQMYSPVGTQDMDADKATKIADSQKSVALWFDDSKIKAVESRFAELRQLDPNKSMSEAEIAAMIRAVPSVRKEVMTRATEIIKDTLGENQQGAARRLSSRLASDAALKKLLR